MAQTQTDEPDSLSMLFIGFVYQDADGALATHVRAMGTSATSESVTCGTADVEALGAYGFYRLLVVSGDGRDGCPLAGERVEFRLLSGRLDEGTPATALQGTTFLPGATSVVSFTPATDGWAGDTSGWAGATGAPAAKLTWLGGESAIVDALAELGRPVDRAWYWDPDRERYLTYVGEGPSFLQTLTRISYGDAVTVYFH